MYYHSIPTVLHRSFSGAGQRSRPMRFLVEQSQCKVSVQVLDIRLRTFVHVNLALSTRSNVEIAVAMDQEAAHVTYQNSTHLFREANGSQWLGITEMHVYRRLPGTSHGSGRFITSTSHAVLPAQQFPIVAHLPVCQKLQSSQSSRDR
jgi:hypothetical protein